MRAILILAAFALCAAPARARSACAAPSAPETLKLPAFTPTRKTSACGIRVEAAYARVQKDADAFLEAQRSLQQAVARVLDIQNGVACEPTTRSYAALRRQQYAAVLKALTEELGEGLGPCGLVTTPSESAPEPDESAPKRDLPPMLEPI
ncbi:MAG: hypothetical protein ACHQ51_08060 [Elusimicrobiota bacterium]